MEKQRLSITISSRPFYRLQNFPNHSNNSIFRSKKIYKSFSQEKKLNHIDSCEIQKQNKEDNIKWKPSTSIKSLKSPSSTYNSVVVDELKKPYHLIAKSYKQNDSIGLTPFIPFSLDCLKKKITEKIKNN